MSASQPYPMVVDVTTLANFLTGVVLPFVIQFLLSAYATSKYRSVFAFTACVVVSLLITILQKSVVGGWSPDAGENAYIVVVNLVALLMSAQGLYFTLYRNLPAFDALRQTGPQLGAAKPAKAKAGIP